MGQVHVPAEPATRAPDEKKRAVILAVPGNGNSRRAPVGNGDEGLQQLMISPASMVPMAPVQYTPKRAYKLASRSGDASDYSEFTSIAGRRRKKSNAK